MAHPDDEYSAAPPAPAQPYPGQPAQYPGQPAYVQPAAAPAQQVVYVPQAVPPAPEPVVGERDTPHGREIVIVSHSMLFYWWPVWVVGYLMALFTWMNGQSIQTADMAMVVHPSNNPGILFFLTVFLVVVITNIEVRGLASALVIMGIILVALFLAYMR
jgi:hypothetical protein